MISVQNAGPHRYVAKRHPNAGKAYPQTMALTDSALPGLLARFGDPVVVSLPPFDADSDSSAGFAALDAQINGAGTVVFRDVRPDALNGFFRLRLTRTLNGAKRHPGLSVVILEDGEPSAPGFASRFHTGWPFEHCLFLARSDAAAPLSARLGVPVSSIDDDDAAITRHTMPDQQKIALLLQPLWGTSPATPHFGRQVQDLLAGGYFVIRVFYDGNARRGPTFAPETPRLIAINNQAAGAHIDVAAMPDGIRPHQVTLIVVQHWISRFAAAAACVVCDQAITRAFRQADAVLANDLDSFALALAHAPQARFCLYPLTDRAARVAATMAANGIPQAEAQAVVRATAEAQAIGLGAADICVFSDRAEADRLGPASKRFAIVPMAGEPDTVGVHAALLAATVPPDERLLAERNQRLTWIRTAAYPPGPEPYRFVNNTAFPLSGTPHDPQVLRGKWQEAEPWGRWTDGDTAGFHIDLADPAMSDVWLEAELVPLPAGGTVTLSVDGHVFAPVEPLAGINRWELPPGLIRDKAGFDVTFQASRAIRPSDRGNSADRRLLGIGFANIRVTSLQPARCVPGQWLRLGSADAPQGVMLDGWHLPEPWGVWTASENARLRLRFADRLAGRYRLELELSGRPETGILEPVIDGHVLPWSDIGAGERAWPLPPGLTLGKTELIIELNASPLFSPAESGESADDRWLGVAVRSVGLFPENAILRTGQTYRIAAGVDDFGVLVSGWHAVEVWGCWSDGHEATLHLPYPADLAGDLVLELDLTPPLLGGMVTVIVNDITLSPCLLSKGWNAWRLPPDCLAGSPGLTVRIQVPQPVRPIDIEPSEDDRVLGIGLSGFRVRSALDIARD